MTVAPHQTQGNPALLPTMPDNGEPDALIEEARARQRRRRVRLGLLGLALAAFAAGAAWILSGSPSHTRVGQIAARETAAVKRSDRFIVHVSTHDYPYPGYPPGASPAARQSDTEEWVDLATGQARYINSSTRGQPSEQQTATYLVNGGLTTGSVDTGDVFYQGRTWSTYSGHQRPGTLPYGPRTITEVTLDWLGAHPLGGSWAYRLVGSQDIDGQPALELQTQEPKSQLASQASQASRGIPINPTFLKTQAATRWDVWISKATYLPIRERIYVATRLVETTDLKWLPPTKTNLALLHIDVPPGFKHLLCNAQDTVCHSA